MRHLNGAKFGSGPVSSKNHNGWLCSTFAFATETTVEELENCPKHEDTAKSTGFWLVFGRIGA